MNWTKQEKRVLWALTGKKRKMFYSYTNPLDDLIEIMRGLTPEQRKKINQHINQYITPQDGIHEHDFVSHMIHFDDNEVKTEILKAIIEVTTPEAPHKGLNNLLGDSVTVDEETGNIGIGTPNTEEGQ